MSPGSDGGGDGKRADVAQVVGHPVDQRVGVAAEVVGVHVAKANARPFAASRTGLSLHRMATRTRRPAVSTTIRSSRAVISGAAEPRLGELIARAGRIHHAPLPTQSLFGALAESIVYQQLSGKAAETILGRVVALYRPQDDFRGPSDILDTPPERLRAAGLSQRRPRPSGISPPGPSTGQSPSIALARRMDDEALVERLTTVRGMGRWTVEMLLMFRLGRADVLPLGDLGVRKGFARTFRTRGTAEPEA